MHPRMAMNVAQHKPTNLRKTLGDFFVIACRGVFNEWPKTTPPLPVGPRDTERLDILESTEIDSSQASTGQLGEDKFGKPWVKRFKFSSANSKNLWLRSFQITPPSPKDSKRLPGQTEGQGQD